MSRFDSEKTPQRRRPWTAESRTIHGSDEQDSEHRAQAWAALGAALVGLGAVGAGTLATVGASAHLWADATFLAGFALACLLVALGVYALVGEFIGGLPLPPTRRERERRRQAQRGPGAETGLSATRTSRPSALVTHTNELRLEATEQDRKLVTKGANVLFRRIVEAELKTMTLPAELHEMVYYNLSARVEAWARELGSTDGVQKFSGNMAADLPRLKVFVQAQLERWRDEHGLSARPRAPQ